MQIVKLIPVVEYNPNIIKAQPYSPEIPFLYRLLDANDELLAQFISTHTENLRAGAYTLAECCALFGGYVLNVDEKDIFFPQCCGDMSDIFYWEALANLNEANQQNLSFWYKGHPAPEHSIHQSQILLDFSVPDISSEAFFPPPSEINVRIAQKGLKLTVKTVFQQLEVLSQKIISINQQLGFNIPDLDKLLLFGQVII